ncbi:peptidoglycan-binding protein [Terribacillus saccharophilus]|uniref:peptidoglycan-binding protein n=1 Tax=Terribacillus saccharophilus TaxID=361277 RepID=UPI002DCD28CC|nr:peptidoglycan-binding protein [Terribacillus saccharophilus]MEC0288905.1 peptidoglycan-binding protein [Terribacillus saccharophilus]
MGRVSLDNLLHRSEKNMGSGMNAIVKKTALEVIRRAYKEGINVQISSGVRSMTEQAVIYGKGRSSYVYKGKQYGNPDAAKVSNAKPGYSIHNFGLAVDYFLTNEEGTKAIWSVNSQWRRVATIAKSLGFAWGGDWSGFKDNPHLEMTGGLSTAQLRDGKRPSLTDRTGLKTAAPSKNISKPAKSGKESVKAAQRWVNQYADKAGFRELDVDGLNGPLTMDALLRIYQLFGKTTIDGEWGPKSRAAGSVQSVKEHQPGWTRLVQATLSCLGYDIGDSGIDGKFGSNTKAAVAAYQRSQGIKDDGVVGPATFTKMFEAA